MPLVNSVATQGSNPAHSAEITIRLTDEKERHRVGGKSPPTFLYKILDSLERQAYF